MNANILILTEAGKDIGLGHFARCQTLEKEFIKQGVNSKTILNLNKWNAIITNAIILNWLENSNEILQFKQFENVLVDSYLADSSVYRFLKNNFNLVCVIDDYNRIKYDADLMINPNVFFNEVNYQNQLAATTGGKDFVILREEFRRQIRPYAINPRPSNMLINIGGSDFRGLLPLLISAALRSDMKKVTVIAPEGLENSRFDKRVEILGIQDSLSMIKLYDQSDMVISGCGQTLHELSSLGKGTIAICLDIDQELNQRFYFKAGFLKENIMWNEENLEERIISAIHSLFPIWIRVEISELARNIVNKDGVENVVKTIIELIRSKNEFIQTV